MEAALFAHNNADALTNLSNNLYELKLFFLISFLFNHVVHAIRSPCNVYFSIESNRSIFLTSTHTQLTFVNVLQRQIAVLVALLFIILI